MSSRTFFRATRFLIVASLLHLAHSGPSLANTGACVDKQAVVLFFNGVSNTRRQAEDGMRAVKDANVAYRNDTRLHYELLYNHTGSSAGASALEDIAETFIQRSREIDSAGQLEDRIDILWEALTHEPATALLGASDAVTAIRQVVESLMTAVGNKAIATLASLISNPPTQLDLEAHKTRIAALASEGQSLLFVGHSQGNLFLNPAFDHAQLVLNSNSMRAIHVAPASPTVRGVYVLVDIDIVINSLRLLGSSGVVPVNLQIPYSNLDPSGHTLVGTYLDSTRTARSAISDDLKAALDSILLARSPSLECPDPFRSHFMSLVAGTYEGLGYSTSTATQFSACTATIAGTHVSTFGTTIDFGDMSHDLSVFQSANSFKMLFRGSPSGEAGFSLLTSPTNIVGVGPAGCFDPSHSWRQPAQDTNLAVEVSKLLMGYKAAYTRHQCAFSSNLDPFSVTLNDDDVIIETSEGHIRIGSDDIELTKFTYVEVDMPSNAAALSSTSKLMLTGLAAEEVLGLSLGISPVRLTHFSYSGSNGKTVSCTP